jgi:hypothetical protein
MNTNNLLLFVKNFLNIRKVFLLSQPQNMTQEMCSTFIRCSFVILIYVLLIITAPIYVLQMSTILRHRRTHFATPFYVILIVNAVGDAVGTVLIQAKFE